MDIKRIFLKVSNFTVSFSLYAAGKLDNHEGLEVPTKSKPVKQLN